MPTIEHLRGLQSGDTFSHDGRALRFVRFRAGKATCVDVDTGERVNLFPTPPAAASESAEAPAGARTEQE